MKRLKPGITPDKNGSTILFPSFNIPLHSSVLERIASGDLCIQAASKGFNIPVHIIQHAIKVRNL